MIEQSISELNEYVGYRCLRLYQKLIANSIDFSINIDGLNYKFYRSYISGDENNLIFIGQNLMINIEYFHLKSDQAGEGYKLQNSFLKLNSLPVYLNNEFIDASLIVVGHWNFAHFIWNQLSALHFLMGQGSSANLVSIRSCLIDLESVFPDKLISDEKSISQYKNSVYLGGDYLNSDAHEFLMNFLKKKLKEINKVNQHEYYLGIRGDSVRCLVNESEFYDFFVEEVLKVQADAIFFVDGFSYTLANSSISSFRDRSDKIDKIINTLGMKYGSDRIININGLNIFDALSYIRNINFYITHEGTMQHKIGWFFLEKNGLILTKSKYASAVALWHKDQVCGALAPSFLSTDSYIYDDDSRNANFSFVDPRRSAIEALGLLPKF
jgi:hypothetical protein